MENKSLVVTIILIESVVAYEGVPLECLDALVEKGVIRGYKQAQRRAYSGY